jgi:hypothetical protein
LVEKRAVFFGGNRKSNKTFFMQIVLNKQVFLRCRHDQSARHQQPSLWHRGLAKDIEGLWERWMRLVVDFWKTSNCSTRSMRHKANAMRRAPSWPYANPSRSRLALVAVEASAQLELRHVGARLSANLVYRAFTRIGDETVPDGKTLARLGRCWARR